MNARSTQAQAFFLTILVIVLLFLSAGRTSAQTSLLNRTLSVGVSGNDVLQLQKLLNSDPTTEVSASGPGSPGQETPYFGALTAAAVSRFQEKYASQILIPNGLSVGTGIVGPSTRAVLTQIAAKSNPSPQNSLSNASSQPVATNLFVSSSTTADASSTNPNLVGLPQFISAVEKASEKKGVSAQELAIIEKQIYHDVATTTDLRKTFLNLIQDPQVSMQLPSPVGRILEAIEVSFQDLIKPQEALAQVSAGSQQPFGGRLFFSFFCSCSGNWLLTIQPLAPNYVTLLTYTPGSQAYLSFNIPETQDLLGFYTPGGGQCRDLCRRKLRRYRFRWSGDSYCRICYLARAAISSH